ncbi:unnamed protein product [Cyprideis torosa]|uniref:Uncharacterized protein n=1 Tax=Cyprideis torosa TaxID=163714 RepID=A0A7R8ZP74_9CRUS|nr:unnamed protein product [Cyprideis torosa]CAG0899803.1 unnamed protein product [Cyprideis torosa]
MSKWDCILNAAIYIHVTPIAIHLSIRLLLARRMGPSLMAVNRPYQKVRIGPLSLPDLTTKERIPNATRSPKSHPKEPFAHQNYRD